ncbi:MAG: glycosyltransferase [Bacteroidales bacterium]|nr:glycosyltransferase [Bacteroidales bacterium]
MKICFFNCAKVWGGGEKWHMEHALALLQEGHQVVVVSNKNSELLKRASARQIKTKSFSLGNLSFLNPAKLFSVYRFFKKEKFDVIIMNFSKDLKVAAPMARLAKIPKIVYRRGSAIPIKNSLSNRFLFRRLTHIIANSEATKTTILQNNPNLFPEERIKVIYNGINIPDPETKKQNDIPVVGTLGRLVYQKGLDILLDIAAILKNRQVVCKIRIGGDGVLKDELNKQARENDLSDYVEFTGFVDHPNEFMNHIDIFVLTSRWEGFGYVLTEAMCAKNPIVAFDISSNPELVFNEENGFLIPFEDKEAFANSIQLLVTQPSIREKMGNTGYEIVKRKFDFEQNKKKLLDFLATD